MTGDWTDTQDWRPDGDRTGDRKEDWTDTQDWKLDGYTGLETRRIHRTGDWTDTQDWRPNGGRTEDWTQDWELDGGRTGDWTNRIRNWTEAGLRTGRRQDWRLG